MACLPDQRLSFHMRVGHLVTFKIVETLDQFYKEIKYHTFPRYLVFIVVIVAKIVLIVVIVAKNVCIVVIVAKILLIIVIVAKIVFVEVIVANVFKFCLL